MKNLFLTNDSFPEVILEGVWLQEQSRTPWHHMIAVILLNQATGVQATPVCADILRRWETPPELAEADTKELTQVLRPCGLQRRRANALKRMSSDYCSWDKDDATDLFGIGKYGSDSYELFFKRNLSVDPADKELKKIKALIESGQMLTRMTHKHKEFKENRK